MKTISEAMNWRYSTKDFDPNKKISAEDLEQLKDILHLQASSINIQPWHYIIADDDAGKARIAKGAIDVFEMNKNKILDCSHVVLFCTRVHADDEYLKTLLEQEDKDGRFKNEEQKKQMEEGRKFFLGLHRFNTLDEAQCMSKQVYLSMGALLLGAAQLGIDAVPMEGLVAEKIDEEFGLREKGYTTIGAVSLGYRSDEDYNADLPKSRLPKETVFSKA